MLRQRFLRINDFKHKGHIILKHATTAKTYASSSYNKFLIAGCNIFLIFLELMYFKWGLEVLLETYFKKIQKDLKYFMVKMRNLL